jgi:hypothetical protein
LIDQNGRVIYVSNLADTAAGQDLSGQSLLAEPYVGDANLFGFMQTDSNGSPSLSYLATGSTLRGGWRIYLVRPLASIAAAMLGEYEVALAWLGGALLISICLALAMVSGISGPLESLDHSVREFNLDIPQKQLNPPAIAPLEVRSIFKHLGELDQRMRPT